MVALAVGIGAVGSLATAPASFAAGAAPKPPAVGTNCQPDGKINGGGSTFQTNAINNAFTYGFQQDVCGPQGSVSNLNTTWGTTDPSVFSFTVGTTTTNVAGMASYNYSLGGVALTNGSGAGLKRLSCRTDMFAGTDLPYNTTGSAPNTSGQLGNPANNTVNGLDGPPGSETADATHTTAPYNCDNGTLNTTAVPPPFGPQPSGGAWPNALDTASPAMAFPVAGGAVAVAVNLNGMCSVATPTAITLTSDEFDKIWQGTINQWNDPELVQTDPILTTDGCAGNIQRVVRQDNSGTTAITMFDLNGINKNNLCGTDSATNWYSIGTASSNAGSWPQGCTDVNGVAAPNPITATTSGSPSLIALLKTTNGGIGYAELGLWGTLGTGISFASLEDAADTTTFGLGDATPPSTVFQSPGTAGAKSHCSLPASVPTGSTPQAAVGLATINWTNTGTPTSPGKQDIAFQGSGYPACGLTFDLVYSLVNNESGEATNPQGAGCVITGTTPNGACQTVAGPVAGMTNDQLRTLYSYFTYVFSPLAQNGTAGAYLPNQTLDPLPAGWLANLTNGYQQNF